MLAGLGFARANLGVSPTSPVDHENDLTGCRVDVCDDLLDESAHETLLDTCIARWRRPRCLEVVREAEQGVAIGARVWSVIYGLHPFLGGAQLLERGVPACLELGRDEAIVGINGFIATTRELHLVRGLLALEIERSTTLHRLIVCEVHRCYGSLHGQGRDHAKQLGDEHLVRPRCPERDAGRHRSVHLVTRTTDVPRMARAMAGVEYVEHPPAALAAQETGEQGAPTAPCLGCSRGLTMGVPGEEALVSLERIPRDVGCMVVAQHHGPLRHRPCMAVGLLESTAGKRRPMRGLPVDVRPCVEGVLQHADDVAIGGEHPLQRPLSLGIDGPGKQEPLAAHVLVYATCALEPLEETNDRPDRLLYSPIGVHLEPCLTRPEIADRDRNAELAALGLGLRTFDESPAHEGELELAHRALEAEKQPVIRDTRVIHPVAVNHTCTNESAEVEQMVPVAPVASEPRRLEAEHRPDDSLAELRDQRFEARPCDEPARRASKILVDGDHLAEAVLRGQIRQLVLPALALEVFLDLDRRRLANVHHGPPLQDVLRKLSALHRRHLSDSTARSRRRARWRGSAPAAVRPPCERRCRAAVGCDSQGATRAELKTASSIPSASSSFAEDAVTPAGASLARASSSRRRSWSAATELSGGPSLRRSQAARSNIQTGTAAREPSGISQIATRSPRRCSRYSSEISRPASGCHA